MIKLWCDVWEYRHPVPWKKQHCTSYVGKHLIESVRIYAHGNAIGNHLVSTDCSASCNNKSILSIVFKLQSFKLLFQVPCCYLIVVRKYSSQFHSRNYFKANPFNSWQYAISFKYKPFIVHTVNKTCVRNAITLGSLHIRNLINQHICI